MYSEAKINEDRLARETYTCRDSKASLLRATFNWKDCITQQFNSIKGISAYHHFWIDGNGIRMKVRESDDACGQ